MGLPTRQLTRGQRLSVEKRTISIFKRFAQVLGKNANEGYERGPYTSTFADQEIESVKTMQLGEVEYTLIICARRTEAA